ncbi:MAG: hypothetical protein HOE90_09310 [Bacteriovoracaceae bacterium]|jgi:hypothetical protein|nr:hypothetical protein [Bacteriovoracaceae bacterium]
MSSDDHEISNIPQMRDVQKQASILDLIHTSKKVGAYFTLWQSPNDEKISRQVHLLKIKEYDNVMEFEPIDKSLCFNSALPIFFYTSYKTLIFKSRIKFNSHFKLAIDIPNSAMAIELRNNKRLMLGKNFFERKFVNFEKVGSNPSNQPVIKRQIIDISEYGMAIKADTRENLKYYVQDKVFINEIAEKHIPEGLYGKIAYLKRVPKEGKIKAHLRIGIKFDQALNLDYIS